MQPPNQTDAGERAAATEPKPAAMAAATKPMPEIAKKNAGRNEKERGKREKKKWEEKEKEERESKDKMNTQGRGVTVVQILLNSQVHESIVE